MRLNLEDIFEPKAIKVLLTVTEMNPRRLLTVAHRAFAKAQPQPPARRIGPEEVKQVLEKALGDVQSRQRAEREIESAVTTI